MLEQVSAEARAAEAKAAEAKAAGGKAAGQTTAERERVAAMELADAKRAAVAEAAQQHPHDCACEACTEKRLRLLRAAPRRPTAPFGYTPPANVVASRGTHASRPPTRPKRARRTGRSSWDGPVAATAIVVIVVGVLAWHIGAFDRPSAAEQVAAPVVAVEETPPAAPPAAQEHVYYRDWQRKSVAIPAAEPVVAVKETPPPAPPAAQVAVDVRPDQRHIKEKHYMLKLINAERVQAGLSPVVLGDNVAAQLHAEASLNGCFSSHWGIDGLKPHMRYSLAGGYQSNGENGLGSDYCTTASDRVAHMPDVDLAIRKAMRSWMDSSGHRRNILRPYHKQVNIGLAWDRYNFKAVQHFEGDYVEYDRLPTIEGGMLSLSGDGKNGVFLGGGPDLGVQIFYDPPPHALTRGQVARTYCYDPGLLIAALRSPPWGNAYYPKDTYTTLYEPCADPYDVAADAPAPATLDESQEFWQASYDASQARNGRAITVPWVTAREWTARGESFAVKADIGDLLARYGKGVYSLIVWGNIGGDRVVISEYSIFHDITPPDTYTVDARAGSIVSPQEAATTQEDQRAPAPSRTYLEPAPTNPDGWPTHAGCASNQSGLPVSLLRGIRFSWAGRDPHRERTGHNFKQQRVPTGGLSAGNRRGFQWFGLRHHRLQGGPGDHHRPRWKWQRAGEVLNTG